MRLARTRVVALLMMRRQVVALLMSLMGEAHIGASCGAEGGEVEVISGLGAGMAENMSDEVASAIAEVYRKVDLNDPAVLDRIAELRDAASPESVHIGDGLLAVAEDMRSEMYEHPEVPLRQDMHDILDQAVEKTRGMERERHAVPDKQVLLIGVGVPVAEQ